MLLFLSCSDTPNYVLNFLRCWSRVTQNNQSFQQLFSLLTQGSEPGTTYAGDASTIDYIWFSNESLGVSGVLREPDIFDVVTRKSPEHCELFASDHLPQMARFYFKNSWW